MIESKQIPVVSIIDHGTSNQSNDVDQEEIFRFLDEKDFYIFEVFISLILSIVAWLCIIGSFKVKLVVCHSDFYNWSFNLKDEEDWLIPMIIMSTISFIHHLTDFFNTRSQESFHISSLFSAVVHGYELLILISLYTEICEKKSWNRRRRRELNSYQHGKAENLSRPIILTSFVFWNKIKNVKIVKLLICATAQNWRFDVKKWFHVILLIADFLGSVIAWWTFTAFMDELLTFIQADNMIGNFF